MPSNNGLTDEEMFGAPQAQAVTPKAGLTDAEMFGDTQGGDGNLDAEFSAQAEHAKRTRGIGETLNDTVIEGVNSAAGMVGAIGSFFKPGNVVSAGIDDFIKEGEKHQSDVVRADKEKFREALKKSETIGADLSAVADYIMSSPLQATAQAIGSFGPTGLGMKAAKVGTGLLGYGERASTIAARTTGVGMGVAGGGGDAAGDAYNLVQGTPDEVLKKHPVVIDLLSRGVPFNQIKDDIATRAARKASVLPGLAGGVAGAFGAEKLLAGGAIKDGYKRILGTGFVEGGTEAIEEGLAQYEGRRAAQQYNPAIDPTKNVAAMAAMGGVLGFGTGAVVATITPAKPDPNILNTGNIDDALAAADSATTPNANTRSTGDLIQRIDEEQPSAVSTQSSDAERLTELNRKSVSGNYVPQPETHPRPDINISENPTAIIGEDAAPRVEIDPIQDLKLEAQAKLEARMEEAKAAKLAQPTEGQVAQPDINEVNNGTITASTAPVLDSAITQSGSDGAQRSNAANILRYDAPRTDELPGLPGNVVAPDGASGVSSNAGEQSGGVGNTNSLARNVSWVIKNKETGDVILETFDKAKVDALNTAKYEAVPMLQHLQSLNNSIVSANPSSIQTPLTPLPASAPSGVTQTSQPVNDQLRTIRAEILKYKGEGKSVTGSKVFYDATDRLKAIAEDAETSLKAQQVWFNSKRKILEKNGDAEAAALFEQVAANLRDRIKTANEPAPIKIKESVAQAASDAVKKTAEVISNNEDAILARLATTKERVGGAVRQRGFNSIAPREQHAIVYKPYGNDGDKANAGYYYIKNRETIDVSQDTLLGNNNAGEKLYERVDGSGHRYRMRLDRKDRPHGYPDFGGDLAVVEPSASNTKSATTPLTQEIKPSEYPITMRFDAAILGLDAKDYKSENELSIAIAEAEQNLSAQGKEALDALLLEDQFDEMFGEKLTEAEINSWLSLLENNEENDNSTTQSTTESGTTESTQSSEQDRDAEAQGEVDQLVKTRSYTGDTVHVMQSDLDGSRTRLPMYTAKGVKTGNAIHRENLDASGEKQKELNADIADNPFFDVVTTKDGKAFASESAAQRELNKRALGDTHKVVPASELQDGANGFVIQRKKPAQEPKPQPESKQKKGSYEHKLLQRKEAYDEHAKAATTEQLTDALEQIGDTESHPRDGIDRMRKEAIELELAQRAESGAQNAEQQPEPKPTDPISQMAASVESLAKSVQTLVESQNDVSKKPENIDTSKERVKGIDTHRDLFSRIDEGDVSADEFKSSFEELLKIEDMIISELEVMTKPEIFKRFPDIEYRYKSEKKEKGIAAAYRDMITDFTLGQSYSYGMSSGSLIDSIRAIVEKTTDESLAEYADKIKKIREDRAAKREEVKAGMDDPVTIEDYQRILAAKAQEIGEGATFAQARMAMPLEQRIRFDELAAEFNRGERARGKAAKQEQSMRAPGEALETTETIKTKHTKHGHDLWQFNLVQRVSGEEFKMLAGQAKRLGGDYSSYRGNGAIPGWQFRTEEAAKAFKALVAGDTSQAKDIAQTRRDAYADDRSQSATERLNEMADKLDEQADDSLNKGRKENTHRRVEQAARSETAARSDKALAQTMRNIANAIDDGSAKFLDQIRQKIQVETLRGFVNTGSNEMLRKRYPEYGDYLKHKDEPVTKEVADYIIYPSYTVFRSDLANIGRSLLEVDGTKKLGQQIMKVADDVSATYLKFAKDNIDKVATFRTKNGERAAFASKTNAEEAIARSNYHGAAIVLPVKRGENLIILSPSEAIKRGIWQGDNDKRITLHPDIGAELVEKMGKAARRGVKISVPWQLENAYDSRKRLAGMNIETAAELRAAVREFIELREAPKEADKVKQMERAMIGRSNDGLDFFPTPESVADEMVQAADIQDGMSVLEPSAGMGHIADRIRDAGVEPDVVELSNSRRELLAAKGYNVVDHDFMDVESKYDRILMNPPFGDRRDAMHVQHAYNLLKPGGRVVAIVGEGVFFGNDAKAQEFREWMEKVGGTDEKLDQGTFLDPSLPVNTGVSARMVVIDKTDGTDGGARFSKSTPAQDTHTVASATSSMLEAHTGKIKSVLQAMLDSGKAKVVTAEQAAGIVGEDALYMTAWHGSPHDHDGFSMDNVGTGEGARFSKSDIWQAGTGEAIELARDEQDTLNQFDLDSEVKSISESGDIDLRSVVKNPKFWDAENEEFTEAGYNEVDRLTLDQARDNLRLPEINELSDLDKAHQFAQYKAMKALLDGAGIEYRDTSSSQSKYLEALGMKLRFADHANMVRDTSILGQLPIINVAPGETKFSEALDRIKNAAASINSNFVGTPTSGMQERTVRADKYGSSELAQKAEAGGEGNNAPDIRFSQDGSALAFYNPADATTYFVSDHIPESYTAKEWQGLVLHEVSVHALNLGRDTKEFQDILNQVELMREAGNKAIVAAFKRVPSDTKPEHVVEEALAYALQESPQLGITQRVIAWFKNAIRAIGKSFPTLQKIKLNDWANTLNESDLRFMAESALRNVDTSGVQNESDTPQFSKTGDTEGMSRRAPSTPEFKEWNGRFVPSKAKGIFYHKTKSDFTEFDINKRELGFHFGTLEQAEGVAVLKHNPDGTNIMPVRLSVKNPLRLNDEGSFHADGIANQLARKGIITKELAKQINSEIATDWKARKKWDEHLRISIQNAGHDGIVYKNMHEGSGDSWIVFEPNQIKSAIGNNGNYSKSNNNILFSKNPIAEAKKLRDRIDHADARAARNPEEQTAKPTPNPAKTGPHQPKPVNRPLQPVNSGHPLGSWIKVFTRNQIVTMYQNTVIGENLKEYKRLREQITADTNTMFEKSDDFLGELRKIPKKLRSDFATLAHEATLHGVDPSNDRYVPSADAVKMDEYLARRPSNKKLVADVEAKLTEMEDAHKRLRAQYMALPEDVRALFNALRKQYVDQSKLLFKEYEARLGRMNLDRDVTEQAIADLRKELATLLSRVYFPLYRSGDFIVVAKKAGEEDIVEFHESEGAQDRSAKTLAKEGYVVTKTKRTISSQATKSAEALGKIRAAISERLTGDNVSIAAISQLMDEIDQTIIRSMPDESYRRSFIHRKGTAGYSNDFIRAYADAMRRSATHIANLRHGDKIVTSIQDMRKAITDAPHGSDTSALVDVANRVERIEQEIVLPTGKWATLAGRIGFAQMLGSLSNFLLNITQTPLLTMPHLGGEYGYTKANLQLAKAGAAQTAAMKRAKTLREIGKAMDVRTRLQGDELEIFHRLHDAGKLDLTQAFDLIDAASNSSDKISDWQLSFMKFVALPQHTSEIINRQVTALATIRLEMARSGDVIKAYKAAAKAIEETHFDYTKENRAEIMGGNFPRVFFMFMQYAQNAAFLWGRVALLSLTGSKTLDADGGIVDGTRPSERTKARKQLAGMVGMQILAAGVLGLPVYSQGAMVAAGVAGFKLKGAKGAYVGVAAAIIATIALSFGDDDGEDFEVELQKWFAEMLGPEWAEILARGVTPRGLASRLDASELIKRTPDPTHDKTRYALEWSKAVSGAFFGGTLAGAAIGVKEMAEGDVERGATKIIPIKQLRDMAQAWKWVRDDYSVLNKDKEIVTKVSKADVFWKAIGVNPSSVVRAREFENAKYQLNNALMDKRKKILIRLVNEDNKEIKFKELIKYNKTAPPGYLITSSEVSGRIKRDLINKGKPSDVSENVIREDFLNKEMKGLRH